MDYEVINGIIGLGRDVLLKLMRIVNHSKKLRQIIGMCNEVYQWKSHPFFHMMRSECSAIKFCSERSVTYCSSQEYFKIPTVKCVLIGDESVGKTSLLKSYFQCTTLPENRYNDDSQHQIMLKMLRYNNYEDIRYVDGKDVHLQLWDTGKEKEEEILCRGLDFRHIEVFLVCFSVIDRDSLRNVEIKWIPEISPYSRNELVSVILVGTKVDLRDSHPYPCIEAWEAEELAQKLDMMAYVECSARTQQNLGIVFECIARTALESRYRTETKIDRKRGGDCSSAVCCGIL